MNNEDLWQASLARVQLNISPANYATWFQSTKILSNKGKEIKIAVPNNFSKEWLENKYDKLILSTLHEIDNKIKKVKYEVIHSELKTKKSQILPETIQSEFNEFKTDKYTNLNPRYLFDNLVVSSFNELSHAAATAICKNPGNVYNPLFFYGGVGLGKTHLIQAIGNEIVKNFPNKKVKYIPAEKYASGIVTAIRTKTIEKLKSQYKSIDVLIIDDIQFIAGKEKTQEEFFHIFNTLYEKNKQIVLSSDRPPQSISLLEERLRSRFEGGMISDISVPDFETRLVILETKLREKNINFSKDILEYLSNNIKTNIRELEGALNKLIMYQKISTEPLDLETTKTLFKDIFSKSIKTCSPKKIIKSVAEFYDLKEKDLFNVSRKQEIIKPRQIAMYILRDDLNCSFPFIGRKFNGKDHTTVIHAYNKICKEIKEDERLEQEINLIKQKIYTI